MGRGALKVPEVPGKDAYREKWGKGSWVVLDAEKQLVSKAAGLVCTGGILRVICVPINTRKVPVGWWCW